jgi:hypothetical protein
MQVGPSSLTIILCCVGIANGKDNRSDLVQKEFAAWNAHDADKVAPF